MENKTNIFAIYLICLFLIIASSCNPIMKAEKRVLNDRESSERVFRELEKTRPCANDTTIITKHDTTTKIDTVTNYKTDSVIINGIKYITKTEEGKTIIKTVYIDKIHTGYIVDTRRLNLVLDSVRYYKVNAQINKESSNSWKWRFWGLLGVLIGIVLIKRFFLTYFNKL